MKKQVILDTNTLLLPGQFMIDVFSDIERIIQEPYELCYVKETIEELERITIEGKERDRMSARLALVLVAQKSLKRLASSKEYKDADESIVSHCDKDTYLATQDIALRKRAKSKGARIIGMRQKKYLAVI